jgi:hypothetical protein
MDRFVGAAKHLCWQKQLSSYRFFFLAKIALQLSLTW